MTCRTAEDYLLGRIKDNLNPFDSSNGVDYAASALGGLTNFLLARSGVGAGFTLIREIGYSSFGVISGQEDPANPYGEGHDFRPALASAAASIGFSVMMGAATAGTFAPIAAAVAIAGGAMVVGAIAQSLYELDYAHDHAAPGTCPFPDDPEDPNPNTPDAPHGSDVPPNPGGPNDPNAPGGPGYPGYPGDTGGGGFYGPRFVPPGADPLSPPQDPLIIDLNGGGFDLVSVTASSANFDLNSDSFAERVGWINSGTGFVVRDLNANGTVDGASELIGGPDQDAMAALAALDSNSDGKVDAGDSAFASLRVWQDADGDGQSDSGELSTLASLGITSFSTTATHSGAFVEGNVIGAVGSATLSNGSTLKIGSAYFATNNLLSAWVAPTEYVRDEDTYALPDLRGYGTVKDLSAEMTLNSDLLDDVQDFVLGSRTMDLAALRAGFKEILYEWTGADAVSPTSRGSYVDAQHLAVVEAFYGDDFEFRNAQGQVVSTNPSALQASQVEIAYTNIFNEMLLRFASQMSLSDFALTQEDEALSESPWFALSALIYSVDYDHFVGNLLPALRLIHAFAPDDSTGALTYYGTIAPLLSGALGDFANHDPAVLKDAIALIFDDPIERAFISAAIDHDPILGDSSAQSISGTSSADLILGAAGNDTIAGGNGGDVYLYSSGGGADVVIDGFAPVEIDRLVIADPTVLPSQVAITRSSGAPEDVTLTFGSGQSVFLDGQFGLAGYGYGVEEVEFSDGTLWSKADLKHLYVAQAQTSGNDTITGFDGSSVISVSDTAGNDFIVESYAPADVDQLVLGSGLNSSNLVITRSGTDLDDLILSFTSHSGSLTLDEQLTGNGYGFESIKFGDGTIWTRDDLFAAYAGSQASSGNDTIAGQNSYADVLAGLGGNDQLSGLTGSDTYVFNSGHGQDTIFESYAPSDTDKLVLGAGLNSTNVSLVRSLSNPNEIKLDFGGSGSITLKDEFSANGYGVEQIQFGNGTLWTKSDLKLAYLSQAQTSGNDTINGFEGSTSITLSALSGNDVLIEGYGPSDTDVIVFGSGLNASNLVITRSTSNLNDVTLSFTGYSGSVKLSQEFNSNGYGFEQIQFGDSTVWGKSDLKAAYLAQAQTSGNDTINGFDGSNTFSIGALAGNDVLSESYAPSDTDVLAFGSGLAAADAILTRSTVGLNDVTISFVGHTGSVKLLGQFDANAASYGYGFEQIQFSGGTTWTKADLQAAYLTRAPTSGADTLSGFENRADVIQGGGGGDNLTGLSGNDTLNGEAGRDTLTGSAGADTFVLSSLSDSGLGSLADLIADFTSGTDKIDLSSLDADSATGGDQAFNWLGTTAFSNVAAQLRYEVVGSVRNIYGDVDGDGLADFQLQLTGTGTLVSGDFVL